MRHKTKILLLGGVILLSSFSARTQQTQDASNANSLPLWDLSGATDEERTRIFLSVQPPLYDETSRIKTEDQLQAEGLAALSLTNAVEYLKLYPAPNDPAAQEEIAAAIDAITHPAEHKAKLDAAKTTEELEYEKFTLWAISSPDEYALWLEPLKTPEDRAAEDAVRYEIEHPRILPPGSNE